MDQKHQPEQLRFTQEDEERTVELLNFIATHAEFKSLSVKQVLQFTKLLNWAQTQLLPKVSAHQFEILSVKEAKE